MAAAIVLVGTLINVIRYYVTAFSIEDSTLHALEIAPAANTPGLNDVLVVVGGLAGAVLTYMLATRVFPIISMWEMREGLLLQRVRRFMKIDIRVMAKPE
ncbi:hypothetical protein FIM08_04620 [SAR202 cluster bacterium AC-647-N09_OGT_505m]|nr:hypothetical protein [SAR202 cluster bacterium AC-647-N09_OGT_505m]